MKVSKTRYLQIFLSVTIVLALVRCVCPQVSGNSKDLALADSTSLPTDSMAANDSVAQQNSLAKDDNDNQEVSTTDAKPMAVKSRFFKADGTLTKNRIFSVPGFSKTFPDQNDVQLAAATKWGVKAVANREDAEKRKSELVYVGSNPFYHIDKLNNSIPYLVPRAAVLLQDIGRNFFDSLQCKGVPLHKIIVTSVLRTKEDVTRLSRHNGNATQNSCHLNGTTVDVCYNRYKTVEAPGEPRRQVRNDTLKWILSEVLRDLREADRCYVKYEVKQGCFHITVK